jgi:hypothetical protein
MVFFLKAIANANQTYSLHLPQVRPLERNELIATCLASLTPGASNVNGDTPTTSKKKERLFTYKLVTDTTNPKVNKNPTQWGDDNNREQ